MSEQSYWSEVRRLAEYFKKDGKWSKEQGYESEVDTAELCVYCERTTAMEKATRDHSWTSNWRAAFRVLSYTDRPDAYEELNGAFLDFDNHQELAIAMARDAFYLDVANYSDRHCEPDTDQTCNKPLEAQQ